MSRKGKMTREEAVAMVGLDAVERVEKENCDFTSRCQCDGDTAVEFSATVDATDTDGDRVSLVAYYYQQQEDVESCENLDELNWEIEGYEVV